MFVNRLKLNIRSQAYSLTALTWLCRIEVPRKNDQKDGLFFESLYADL